MLLLYWLLIYFHLHFCSSVIFPLIILFIYILSQLCLSTSFHHLSQELLVGGTCHCGAKFPLYLTTKLIIHDTYSVFSLISVTLCIDQRLEERSNQRVKGLVEGRQEVRQIQRDRDAEGEPFYPLSLRYCHFPDLWWQTWSSVPSLHHQKVSVQTPLVSHLLFCL